MAKLENHAGIKISESKLQVVEVNYKNDRFLLENVDESYFNEPINFNKDKETKISALMQGAFDELQIRKPLKSSLVSFALPFELFYSIQCPFDNTLLHQDLIEEFRWELSIIYPNISPQNLIIQYVEIEKNSFINWNSAFVIGIQRKFVQLLQRFCEKNNLNLKFVDNIHIASNKALSLSKPVQSEGILLSVYYNTGFLSLIFSLNNKPFHFKLIPIKSAAEIASSISNEIDSGNAGITKNQIGSAFITGDEVSASIVKALSQSVGLDFRYFNPFDNITPDTKILNNNYFTEKYYSFSPAAGIAYRLT